MSPRVLVAALAAAGAVWAGAVVVFGWWGAVTVIATSVAITVYALLPRREQPPLPLRDPGPALAEAIALEQLATAIEDLDTCEALWAATEWKEDAS